MSDQPKTFDELERDAAAKWRHAAQLRSEQAAARAAEIANSPDVRLAPPLGTLWSHPAIVCPCGSLTFIVQRYGCLNGKRDKCELRCTRCETTRTWIWESMTWSPHGQ